jgi:hypothetical protein
MQIGVDMAANLLKEFWPDLARKFKHKRIDALAKDALSTKPN